MTVPSRREPTCPAIAPPTNMTTSARRPPLLTVVVVVACLTFLLLPSSSVLSGASLVTPAVTSSNLSTATLRNTPSIATASQPTASTAATWVNLSSGLSQAPPSRTEAAMVTDSETNSVLLYGGCAAWLGASQNCARLLGDTWNYSHGTWTNATPPSSASPPARDSAMMADDPADGYVVLFGGSNALGTVYYNDTWTFRHGEWTNITATAGHAPSPRADGAFAYDPVDHEDVLYGGGASGGLDSDTWTFAAGVWTELTASSAPGTRCCSTFAWDAQAGDLVLFGGADHGSLADTWTFVGGVWTSSSASGPAARCCAGLAPDPATGGLVLFGGESAADTWNFTGGAWQSLAPSSSAEARSYQGMAYDPSDGYVLMFGGEASPGGPIYGDTWAWKVAPAPPPPALSITSFTATPSIVLTETSSTLAVTAAGGTPPYSYAYTGLPVGCPSADSASLSCTASAPGHFWINVTVADAASATAHASTNLTVQNPGLDDWRNLTGDLLTAPSPRTEFSMATDSSDDEVVLFGGCAAWAGESQNCAHVLGDTWTYKDGVWTNITSTLSASPSPRDEAMMSDDPGAGYVLLFGGSNADGTAYYNDTWTFHAGVWTNTTVSAGHAPAPRAGGNLAFDSSNQVMVLYGGGSTAGILGDTWSFSGGHWSELAASSPPGARCCSALAYDAQTGELVLFGGADHGSLGDTWSFVNGVWTELSGSSPSARCCSDLAADPPTGGMILFGGNDLADTWNFTSGGWLELAPTTSPAARSWQGMAYDPSDGYILMFGGETSPGGEIYADTWAWEQGNGAASPLTITSFTANPLGFPLGTTSYINVTVNGGTPPYSYAYSGLPPGCSAAGAPDLVCTPTASGTYPITVTVTDAASSTVHAELNLTVDQVTRDVWMNITTGLPHAPSARSGAAIATDSADGYVLLFGGCGVGNISSCTHYLNDTWIFRGGDWYNISASLTTSPSPRWLAGMTYDAEDGYVVLFGGWNAQGDDLGDTWTYKAGVWTNITATAGSPPARANTAMAYDPADHEVVMFGGTDPTGALGDTWTFSAGHWAELQPSSAPSPRCCTTLAYDAQAGYLVLFGGGDHGSLGDTWSFVGGVWTQLAIGSPGPRCCASLTADPETGGVILFGGDGTSDTWNFTGGVWNAVGTATAPSPRSKIAVAYDSGSGDLVLFGGADAFTGEPRGDTWEWGAIPSVPAADHGPTISTFTASPDQVTVGTAVVLSVAASGGIGPLRYSYAGLPQGCASRDLPSITCTPSASDVGTYTVIASVTDLGQVVATSQAVLIVNAAPQNHPSGIILSLVDWVGIVAVIVVVGVSVFLLQRSRRKPELPSDAPAPGLNPYADYQVPARGPAAPSRPSPGPNGTNGDPKTDPLQDMV